MAKSNAANQSEHIWRGVESLRQLAEAHRSGVHYQSVASSFVSNNGKIRNSYFTPSGRGCVVAFHIDHRLWWRDRRQVLLWHDYHAVASQVTKFNEVLGKAMWIARETERGTDLLLPRRNRMVVANLLFTVLVLLLGTLDVVASKDTPIGEEERERLTAAAEWANDRLERIDEYVEKAGRHAVVQYYLCGLPLGLSVIAALILIFREPDLVIGKDPNLWLTAATAGSLGSITSVMIRITRGQKLSIDPRQRPTVTVVSGAFRPLIGAVFGVAFYVLVEGGLLPLALNKENPVMYYAGLAFLAGFSERWAQDTVVRSAPISPSQVISANGAGKKDEADGKS